MHLPCARRLALVAACLVLPATAAAADKTAAQLLPETVAIYAEIGNPKQLMDVVLDHPLRGQVEQLDAYKQAVERKAYRDFRASVAVVEQRIGKQWRPALETLCRAGRVIAWGETENPLEGAVVARKPQDLIAAIETLCPVDLSIAPHSEDVRYRHVAVDGEHLYILCNEGMARVLMDVHVAAQGARSWVDPWRSEETPIDDPPSGGPPRMSLAPYTTMILRVTPRT